MEKLPIEKFFGVGKVTAAKMKSLGLHYGADLKKLSEVELTTHFGKTGKFFYKIVRGEDHRPVQPHRKAKSVGAEDTFPYDLTTLEEMTEELDKIGQLVCDRLARNKLKGKTLTLKIKYHDFKQITRSQSFDARIDDLDIILSTAKQLLQATDAPTQKVRLLGISLSNFYELELPKAGDKEANDQLKLF